MKDITYADNFTGMDPWRTDYRSDVIGLNRGFIPFTRYYSRRFNY